ncbi:MAG: hypothetical protein BAJALOKI1v1_1730003 [Promethearchaeota archaeon]|nr:MAG: hypothetical protein BAJALOKI1v1_1730003 [Candidatus Lokiarchaeota archaeon]
MQQFSNLLFSQINTSKLLSKNNRINVRLKALILKNLFLEVFKIYRIERNSVNQCIILIKKRV